MDLGLNHVLRKAALPVESSAHLLVPVPGGGGDSDGPGGVIVGCENFVVYKKKDHEDIYCALPRRLEMGQEKGLGLVAYAVHRMREFFFILVQSEYGDLYKIEVSHEEGVVRELTCRYFDSVPVANALSVLKSGYLLVASEFADHLFYQFTGIGTDTADPLCTSAHPLGRDAIIAFKPRPLRNLQLADEMLSLSPILDLKILEPDHGGQSALLFAACGRGSRSALRLLQHGVGVEEMADNELPGKPKAVWTIKENNAAPYDGYIVVGFDGSSLVLQIGDTVEEVAESSFLTNVTSLHIALLYDDSYLQVHETGIRHIIGKRVHEWKIPGGRRIKVAASNDRQIVISLSGGELVYFEIDESGTMKEICTKDLNAETSCLALQPVPTGRTKASFLAVGSLDGVVRLLSLESERNLRQVAAQVLQDSAPPESVCLLQVPEGDISGANSVLYLNIGLASGLMVRAAVDAVTGALSDLRSRFLGAGSVRFHLIKRGPGDANTSMLALSEKSWLCYPAQGKLNCVPLNYDLLDFAASFSSEQCVDGFVAVASGSLRIFRCSRQGEVFSQTSLPLAYTPRHIAVMRHPADVTLGGWSQAPRPAGGGEETAARPRPQRLQGRAGSVGPLPSSPSLAHGAGLALPLA
eukprot:GHVT01029802.1.p1 GENE.GHVT01029802.1~~GHVT01029802.1.p1  ORF type:complete len:731 (+),score=211.20 GHVT01029802.1:281-2194(+)